MKRYTSCVIAFICTLIIAFGTQATVVSIDPAIQESPPAGETLTVGVKIEDVADLYGYDMLLVFDNTALKFSSIQEEVFLRQDGILTIPFLMLGWEEEGKERQLVLFEEITPEVALEVNSVGGLLIGNSRTTDVSGISGTDLLVTITFEVLEARASVLQLGNADHPVALFDSTVDPNDPEAGAIETDVVDGSITSTPNVPPIAVAGDDQTVDKDTTVNLDGSASSDSDGAIVSYAWDFGDGNTAEGATVSHVYPDVGRYTVTLTITDDDGDTGTDTLTVNVQEPLPPVIREHSPDSTILALQATYDEANVHGHTYIDIWKGDIPVEAGMFLEFQVAMFSGNTTFNGSVDLHTSDGGNLRDSGTVDQNGVNAHPAADLSGHARDQWYHRKISLDALAGKTIDGIMIATDSNEHLAGIFRVYVDNIQITDGEHILTAIYIDEETIPSTGTNIATETTFAGTEGMSNSLVTIVGETPVNPAGKLVSSWGSIKGGRY
ncbi:PKD domain-containing protein [Candidatus Poribacteria bacterium]